jgi:hypothetical protein
MGICKKIVPIFARTLTIASAAVTAALYIPFKICVSTVAVVATCVGGTICYIITGKSKSMEIFEFFYFTIEKTISKTILEPYFETLFKYSNDNNKNE